MTHGSLFSGMGGFDLASEWMGWDNVFHCEWNEFVQRMLKYYWPDAISYEDITKADFTVHRGKIDVLTGGFPCQPYSAAGKRLGKEDDRHLWPEMLRAICEIRPKWVVGENVLGIVNWNGGLVFDEVQADLEAQGYEVQPYVLPACAKDAPHRRDRVWFVANAIDGRDFGFPGEHEGKGEKERVQERHEVQQPKEPIGLRPEMDAVVANTEGLRSRGLPKRKRKNDPIDGINGKNGYATNTSGSRWIQNHEQQQAEKFKYARPGWQEFPTQSPICTRNDGISAELDGITFPKWRSESIKAAGNAIVPQVVYEIFKVIEKMENQNQ